MTRNESILIRLLSGDTLSDLAKEHRLCTAVVSEIMHNQIKKAMPELYVGKSENPRLKHLRSIKKEVLIAINDYVIERARLQSLIDRSTFKAMNDAIAKFDIEIFEYKPLYADQLTRSEDLLIRVLSGEKTSKLAKEYGVSSTFIQNQIGKTVAIAMKFAHKPSYTVADMKSYIPLKNEVLFNISKEKRHVRERVMKDKTMKWC